MCSAGLALAAWLPALPFVLSIDLMVMSERANRLNDDRCYMTSSSQY